MRDDYDPDCDFCEIANREEPARVVLRSSEVVAFFPLEPATLGHTLVVPRVHVQDIWSLDDETAHLLTDAVMTVARGIRRAMNLDGLNIIQSNGEAATQTVPHLHVHVVPRQFDDGMGKIWPPETNWSEDAKNDAWELIRQEVQR